MSIAAEIMPLAANRKPRWCAAHQEAGAGVNGSRNRRTGAPAGGAGGTALARPSPVSGLLVYGFSGRTADSAAQSQLGLRALSPQKKSSTSSMRGRMIPITPRRNVRVDSEADAELLAKYGVLDGKIFVLVEGT